MSKSLLKIKKEHFIINGEPSQVRKFLDFNLLDYLYFEKEIVNEIPNLKKKGENKKAFCLVGCFWKVESYNLEIPVEIEVENLLENENEPENTDLENEQKVELEIEVENTEVELIPQNPNQNHKNHKNKKR